MKILLIGGTGAIGIPLSKILSKKNNQVYITSRRDRKDDGNIRYLKCDGHNNDELESVASLHHWDVIVDFLVYSSEEFPEHVKRVITRTNQYIFISSARVFAESEKLITETSPRLLDVCQDNEYLRTDEYALRKARCENYLKRYNNYTIVRPSITFNEYRLQLGVYEVANWLTRILKDMPIVLSNDIMSKFTTMTFSEDVARAIVGICGNTKAHREDYNLVTSEYYTWEEITHIYLECLNELNIIPKIKTIEHNLNLKAPALKYQVLYARLFNRAFDNSKLLDLLPDFKFSNTKLELKRCLLENVRTYNHETLLSITNILQDRECGYITRKSEIRGVKRYLKYLIALFIPEKLLIKQMG